MQVYRGMDIGTAKATAAQQARVPHHLIDLVEPSASFSVAEFQEAGRAVLDELDRRNRNAVIAGGSGLHFRAIVDPMVFPPTAPDIRAELESTAHDLLIGELLAADPDAGDHVDLANPRRVLRAVEVHRITGRTPSQRAAAPEAHALRDYQSAYELHAIGVDPGDRLATFVEKRFDAMLAGGLLDEVDRLAPDLGPTARQAVGYKELIEVVSGERSIEEGRALAIQATLHLAKRQRTFFRRDPRIRWIPWHDDPAARQASAWAVVEEASWTS